MSVLLFMPESGGNPLDSVIMTSDDQEVEEHPTISRFDLENGKPALRRTQSRDSGSIAPSSAPSSDTEDDVSSLGDDDSQHSLSSPAVMSPPRKSYDEPRVRSRSNDTFSRCAPHRTRSGAKSESSLRSHPSMINAKQPQSRLSTMGALLGATTPMVVKAVTQAQERNHPERRQRTQSSQSRSASPPSNVPVYLGFLV